MTKDELIELAQVGMGIHSPNQPEYIVCKALIKALAQPEQEPVGRFAKFTDGIWREVTDGSAGLPLYTTPPQRKPLTDEEIFDIAKNYALSNPTTPLHFARAIEAKLRSKNNV